MVARKQARAVGPLGGGVMVVGAAGSDHPPSPTIDGSTQLADDGSDSFETNDRRIQPLGGDNDPARDSRALVGLLFCFLI